MRKGRPPATAEQLGTTLVQLARRPEARTADVGSLLGLDSLLGFDSIAHSIAELADLACRHRVPGVVYRALAGSVGDDRPLVRLREAYQMASLAHGRGLAELAGMAATLCQLEQPWLVVKGPVLVEIGYGDPGARLYEDLDLVVAPRELSLAVTLIEAAGGRVADLNWPMMADLRRAEIPMTLPSGMLGDLHWHLLVTPGVRSRFGVSMAELVERRRSVRIGGIDLATLDVIDGILYLCLHGSLSGGHQLVWLEDLDQMLVAEPPDWDEMVRRARRSGVDLVAAIQLERARTVLGAPVPEPVVEALAGSAPWWRLWRWREEQVGAARWGGLRRTGRTFVSATSDGSRASTVQLVRSLADDLVRPGLSRLRSRVGLSPVGSTTEPAPLYRPVGGPAGRARYLAEVGTGAWS